MKYAFCVAEDINLGVGYIITYLKAQGHDVRLFFDPRQFNRGYARNKILANLLSTENYNIRQIEKYKPDVCMISCVTATYRWALQIAKKIKGGTSGCKILIGGVHPTLCPEEVKKHDFIDGVVEGCGIEYFGGKFEPDKIFPEREMFFKELPPEHRKAQLFMTSFGCPYNCSFCGNEQLRKINKQKIFRRRPTACIAELQEMKENGCQYVLFVDDIFSCDKHFLAGFARLYKEKIGLPFACFVHPNHVSSDIVNYLKDMGCHTAWMGIQTGNEQLRTDILGRRETNKQIIEAAKLVKEAGIKLMVDHIFGIPYESNETNDLSYGLYREIKADVVNCYELLYFPKAKIIDHAIRFGYLKASDVPKIERGEFIKYQIGNKGNYFYDTYAKVMHAIPLGSILWELLPTTLIKVIVHLKAGRAFMLLAIMQNEIYFTWRAILKKMRLI